MTPEERDEEKLAEFLKGDSEISRLYRRDAGEEPGADLDARVLSRARRAVERKHRVVHSPFARHWMVPASLAAVLVLAVTVVVLAPDPALESGAPVDTDVEAVDAVGAGDAKEDGSLVAPLQAPARAPAPTESRPRREQTFEDKIGTRSGGGGRAGENQPGLVPGARQSTDETVGKSGEKRKAAATERDQPEAPVPSAGAASMAAPAALEESARASEAMPAPSVQDDPERWLRHIEMLFDEQRGDLAGDSLRAFRARYPEFPLPASLLPLAETLDAERQ